MIVVSDATPLNALVRIGEVELLRELFHTVLVPKAVFDEPTRPETPAVVRDWVLAKPAWIEGDSIRGIRGPSKSGGGSLANAEATPYNLSRCPMSHADLLLLLVDDKKARAVARRLGLRITGTIGVLELGAELGHIHLQQVFDRLRRTDFEVSEEILQSALARASRRDAGS